MKQHTITITMSAGTPLVLAIDDFNKAKKIYDELRNNWMAATDGCIYFDCDQLYFAVVARKHISSEVG